MTNKEKGSRFEYLIKWGLQMISFEVIRAWSSIGTADLIASPPWNPMGNNQTLLIQAKNSSTHKDYISPFERDHLTNLQDRNSGMVLVVYMDNRKVMCKIWETQEKMTFDEFIKKYYGINCNIRELNKNYKLGRKPIHLYYPPKDEKDRVVSSFHDLYDVDVWVPYVPHEYRKAHV